MSGYKESTVAVDRERQHKLAVIEEIRASERAAVGLREQLGEYLQSTPVALKEAFAEEVRAAEAWLHATENLKEAGAVSQELTALTQLRQQANTRASGGQHCLTTVRKAFTRGASEKDRQLGQAISDMQTRFLTARELLRTWNGPANADGYHEHITALVAGIQAHRYLQVEETLATLNADLTTDIARAEERERQDQQRRYVLDSLRQVCANLGFIEIAGPRYEDPHDRTSAILLSVDTMNRGPIDFTLSLTKLTTLSDMHTTHCIHEFDQLSAELEEFYGVHTAFTIDDEPLRVLKEAGSLDEPNGQSMQAGR